MDVPYIIGSGSVPDLPLGRFIPPIPSGMVRTWSQKNLSPGNWILEPFGFNPMVPIELAEAGYPVLVTVNNPIHAFMLRVIASAPQEDELIASLQDLAIAPKGEDRIEPYIRSLYTVTCADCKNQIEAESFLWEKGSNFPFAAQVACPFCGTVGEQEISEEDKNNLAALPPIQLHRARALNRIVERDDTLRTQVKNTLNAYPARPLIILQTIINKLDSLEQTARRRELLTALILSAADQGNTLWAYPSPRQRPRQIVVPNIYQERNLWKVMEESIKTWQVIENSIPVYTWGEETDGSIGIHLFQGRVRELTPQPDKTFFSTILAAIPRPNQAFWTLSAIWTGWLWGQHAVSPIRNVLSRQRYDWNWHTNALNAVFDAIKPYYHPKLKFWGLVAENEPMLLLASLMAAETSGFTLTAFAQSLDDQLAQCYWIRNKKPFQNTKPDKAFNSAKRKVGQYLSQKGESANYQKIHTAAITGLAKENELAIDIFLQNPNSGTSETQKWIEAIFTEEDFLTRIGGGTASLETGEWWLKNPLDIATPLIDCVEDKIYQHLLSAEVTSARIVKEVVYDTFQGNFTPQNKVILNCLESYADLLDQHKHLWKLRECEQLDKRKADITDIRDSLCYMGQMLNYETICEEPILWLNEVGKPVYSFHVFSSAAVSRHIRGDQSEAKTKILVFPDSRSNLLAFKRQRDPLLANALEHNFLVVIYRLIKDLVANPLLSRELFIEQIQVEPPEYHASQLALF